MCLSPRKIKNKSKYKSSTAASKFLVPCGQCKECQELKKTSYVVRSYWEYEKARRSGGYTYFDTLTYNPKKLPTIDGNPCFDSSHIKYFIKLLKVRLGRSNFCKNRGIDSQRSIRFFLTSEYGGKNHRPHYHILFFVTDPRLDVFVLKKYINQCWHEYGFTDQITKTREHVLNSVRALFYVSKYVTKDVEFNDTFDSSSNLERRNKPFIRSSMHFGECAFDFVDGDMINNGEIYYLDAANLRRVVSLPLYYRRKRFYDLKKYLGCDGHQHYSFVLNKVGYDYLNSTFDNKITKIVKSFNTWLDNCDNATFCRKFTDRIDLRQLAAYKLVYQDRFIDYVKYKRLSAKDYFIDQYSNLAFIHSLYAPSRIPVERKLVEASAIHTAVFSQDFYDEDGFFPFENFDFVLSLYDTWYHDHSEEIRQLHNTLAHASNNLKYALL